MEDLEVRVNKSGRGHQNKKYNLYDLSGAYGIGYTSKGEEFWFDLEDYDKINEHCWFVSTDGYIVSHKYIDKEHYKSLSLHRIVMNCPDGLMVDHIKGRDTRYDNRKSNLRICTNSENMMNVGIKTNNKSGRTGVWFDKTRNKWVAEIRCNNKKIFLGRFESFNDAVAKRELAEKELFKNFCVSI